MVTYSALFSRLPGAHENGRANFINFTCPLCHTPKAFVRIAKGRILTGCASCFQSDSIAERVGLLGETIDDNPQPDPAPLEEEVKAHTPEPEPLSEREPGEDKEEDTYQEDLKRWQLGVFEVGKTLLSRDLELRKLSGDALFIALVDALGPLVNGAVHGYAAPAVLSPEQVKHELEVTVRALLPNDRAKLKADREFADRRAVDAFQAWQQIVTDRRDYSVEALVRDGCTALLSGLMGSGKSTLLMNIARSIALGEKVLDRQCRQGKVLVVVSSKEYEAWAETIGFWQLQGVIFLHPSTHAHFGDTQKTVEWFDWTMRDTGARFFILDTLFDFFGMPESRSGDQNRIVMNEQTPLLELVRERNFSGIVAGHAPKSEAQALVPRDPEESFGGHTAWTAQHRMRIALRRKTQGFNAIVAGRGGYGDRGIPEEQLLRFDPETRLVSLSGAFSDHMGEAALPIIEAALTEAADELSRADLEKATGRPKVFVLAGLRAGIKSGVLIKTGGGRNTKYGFTAEIQAGREADDRQNKLL